VLFHTRYGQGQRALFHVLHAFGLHCDDIGGYCQGMGPIAATLLCYFEPEVSLVLRTVVPFLISELMSRFSSSLRRLQRAYAGLVRLFDQYQLRHIFEPGFPGLVETFYVQERLVELFMPDVHQAFVRLVPFFSPATCSPTLTLDPTLYRSLRGFRPQRTRPNGTSRCSPTLYRSGPSYDSGTACSLKGWTFWSSRR
jgi:hypothetical protein